MGLADIAHVQFVRDQPIGESDAGAIQQRRQVGDRRIHFRPQTGGIYVRQQPVQRVHAVVPHVRNDAAESRGNPREAWHQGARETDLADQRPGMQSAGAAERHQSEPCRVMAALDRHQP